MLGSPSHARNVQAGVGRANSVPTEAVPSRRQMQIEGVSIDP
jgi:hypothetical protein